MEAGGAVVALLRFSAGGVVGGLPNVVTAVLQLHLQPGGGNDAPQVLTVLGREPCYTLNPKINPKPYALISTHKTYTLRPKINPEPLNVTP